jgi:pantoate--beta-alanine ligase
MIEVVETTDALRRAVMAARTAGKTVGFVPTMGALHAGHLTLVQAARAQCDAVVATIFVNPTQFGPSEDFSKYPRTFEADCELLRAANVDLLFAPDVAEIYPAGATTFVSVEGIEDRLDGQSRPGHFRGVATVVAKLFHIVAPSKAFFGQKDAAQVAILRRMVRDLHFDLEIVVCPIVRETDGLAMSSRNRYLNEDQRQSATVLYRTLTAMQERVEEGEVASSELIDAGLSVLSEEPDAQLDYLRVVDPDTLEDLPDAEGGALLAVAARFGSARLIDNVLIPPR